MMAARMRKQAARAKDLRVQAQMLIVAKDWDRLAKNAEELERRRSIFPGPDDAEP
jgi:hypothetical protein